MVSHVFLRGPKPGSVSLRKDNAGAPSARGLTPGFPKEVGTTLASLSERRDATRVHFRRARGCWSPPQYGRNDARVLSGKGDDARVSLRKWERRWGHSQEGSDARSPHPPQGSSHLPRSKLLGSLGHLVRKAERPRLSLAALLANDSYDSQS